MNNTQQPSEPESEMPLTAASMPRQPRLYNPDRRNGLLVKFYVLGYPLTSDELIQWADNHRIAPNKDRNNRRHLTWKAICGRLPQSCRRWALVINDAGALTNCVVIATNGSTEDMEKAKDLETIRTVQKVVDVHAPPKWYKMIPD